jgi:hypothetical protein
MTANKDATADSSEPGRLVLQWNALTRLRGAAEL